MKLMISELTKPRLLLKWIFCWLYNSVANKL